MNEFDEDFPECPDCGYVGEFETVENPEHLHGVVGCTSDVCPECGWFDDGLA